MTATERTAYLLETLLEAQEVMGRGGGGDGEGMVPLMSKMWNSGSYKALDKLLRERMRVERPKQHWHVSQRYLNALDKVIEVKVIKRNREQIPILPDYTVLRGQPAFMSGGWARVAVRVYPQAVRLEVVRKGVDWLTSELGKEGGVWLPTLLVAA